MMADYLTSVNPTTEDWLECNAALFAILRQGRTPSDQSFAPLIDIDRHAGTRRLSVDQLFEELQERVGDLGSFKLKLDHSDMDDDAWHVILVPKA
jgi:hypothetical protein